MEQINQPLANRLRDAAIGRTDSGSERVDDDFVLDPDGVIDLRELHSVDGRSIAAPAEELATIRGQLGDWGDVSSLYDESEPVPRWRLGLRARHAFGMKPGNDTATADNTAPAGNSVDGSTTEIADQVAPRSLSVVADVIDLTDRTVLDEPELDDPLLNDAVLDEALLDEPVVDEPDDALDAEPAADLDTDSTVDDEDRPEAVCPSCGEMGQRDLFDRFSQIEFYSCDSCNNMWQQELS